MDGLVEVKGRRSPANPTPQYDVEVMDTPKMSPDISGFNKLAGSFADNMPKILDLVAKYMEIRNIREKTDAQIKLMEQNRQILITQTESYIRCIEAETDGVVKKMEVIRRMMKDYNECTAPNKLPYEDFRNIISEIISSMNGVSNG